jgi:hypothetical protein
MEGTYEVFFEIASGGAMSHEERVMNSSNIKVITSTI